MRGYLLGPGRKVAFFASNCDGRRKFSRVFGDDENGRVESYGLILQSIDQYGKGVEGFTIAILNVPGGLDQ